VCYVLRIASPLTLSEVRSMLPAGITADPLPSGELARIRLLLPSAQTLASLQVGSCACDLVRPRLPDTRDDERHLRARYKALALPRERIIRELERHRRRSASAVAPSSGSWPEALAGFVAEHARNAGPTLFQLSFLPDAEEPRSPPRRRTVADVRTAPDAWLEEGAPILVSR
jgi:hypothetical protein